MGRPWGSPKGAVDRDMDRGTLIGVLGLSELELKPIPNTGPYYTDASAAGGSGRTCVAQSDERRGGGQRPVGALGRVCAGPSKPESDYKKE